MHRHHILSQSLSAIRSGVLVVLSLVLVLSSCTNDDLHLQQQGTVSMLLDGGILPFDETRASHSFVNGDRVYLRLDNDVYGVATYSTTTASWSFAFTGTLSGGVSGSCTAYYVDPSTAELDNGATLNAHSAVYVGMGTYINTDAALSVSATLSPQVGRLRFKGTSGTSLTVSGITYYTSLDVSKSTSTLSSTSSSITLSVGSNGYTSYVYGSLGSDRQLQVVSGDITFNRTCSSTVLSAGRSGYLTLPTSSSHAGWSVQGGSPSTAGHEYVDLGLPSGTLWATCNVGANSPEEYGDYFAWGETEPQSSNRYYWDSYKWMASGYTDWKGCTKYTFADGQTSGCWYSGSIYVGTTVDGKMYQNLTKLLAEDDAATVNWGSDWCMPTHVQQQELVNSSYTTTTWTTQNGVYGLKITSKSNGNSIFLPAAGYRYSGSLYLAGSYGDYWSSELDSGYSNYAWLLYFYSSYVSTSSYGYRCNGRSVRPVRRSSSE